MGLNKHGWGMKEMIIFSSILFAFLLVAVFYILRLYHGLEQTGVIPNTTNTSSYSYSDVEQKVLDAGIDYYNEYYESDIDVTITTSIMKKHGFLQAKDLKPKNEKKECNGYVVFIDGEPEAFIQCENYETIGYEE